MHNERLRLPRELADLDRILRACVEPRARAAALRGESVAAGVLCRLRQKGMKMAENPLYRIDVDELLRTERVHHADQCLPQTQRMMLRAAMCAINEQCGAWNIDFFSLFNADERAALRMRLEARS